MNAQEQIDNIFGALKARLMVGLAELPTEVIAVEVVNYSMEAFDAQGWNGEPWQPDKDKKKVTGSILVKSGNLKRSIRMISSTSNSVVVGSDIPYAPAHNFGLEISKPARQDGIERKRYVRTKKRGKFRLMTFKEKHTPSDKGFKFKAYSFRMPRRTFLAITPELKARVRIACVQHMRKYLKP